jgi:glycosyltransferase involved in cell wall biosynthesis
MATTRPVKVLHFTECLEGGVGQAISRWVNQSTSDDVQHYVLGRVRLTDRAIAYAFNGEQTDSIMNLIKRYRMLLREWNPDVVHIHSTKAGIIARVLSNRGTRIAYSPHCFAFLMLKYPKITRSLLKSIERALSFRTDYIVAVSPYEARIAQEVSSKSCTVLLEPNIASPTVVRPASPKAKKNDCIQIRAVGRYCTQKNPQLMKSILDELAQTDIEFEFLWIGSPDDDQAEVELPISGWLPQDQVEAQLQSADILLHTAAWEAGVPLVALDAIGLGTPVVMLKRPEYEEILSQGLFEDVEAALNLICNLTSESAREHLLANQHKNLEIYLATNSSGLLKQVYLTARRPEQ